MDAVVKGKVVPAAEGKVALADAEGKVDVAVYTDVVEATGNNMGMVLL